MYQRDYILRLIERFGATLRAIRDRLLRRQADPQAARSEIGEIAREAGMDLDVARRLDTNSLLLWLSPGLEPDPGRLWLMAELLYLDALAADDAEVRRADVLRAIAILERLPGEWRPVPDVPAVQERLDELRGMRDDEPV